MNSIIKSNKRKSIDVVLPSGDVVSMSELTVDEWAASYGNKDLTDTEKACVAVAYSCSAFTLDDLPAIKSDLSSKALELMITGLMDLLTVKKKPATTMRKSSNAG